ncbi:MAG: hypothetical protein WCT29_01250 [Candidatus Paceibacterota bacterium]
MRKARILLTFGVWVAILPYLGFPYSWKSTLFTLTGLGLIYFSYVMYQDYHKDSTEENTFDNFRENSNFDDTQIDGQ